MALKPDADLIGIEPDRPTEPIMRDEASSSLQVNRVLGAPEGLGDVRSRQQALKKLLCLSDQP